MARLNREEVDRIKRTEKTTEKKFSFGTTNYVSKRELELPAWVGKQKIYIRTYVLDGDVPWLIGRITMQNLKMRLDLETNTVDVVDLGETVRLRVDDSGHLRIKLGARMEKENVWTENLLGDCEKERKVKLRKLHLQFGHPGKEKLVKLIEEAWRAGNCGRGEKRLEDVKKEIRDISEECETCQRFRKTPARPVVGLTWSNKFNEVVAMDLGEFEGRRFLVIVDMGTRYVQACWLRNKKPEEVIQAFVKHWVALFGCPQVVLTDNGGEFQNESFLRMSEMFGIKCKTTAAESPFSNGLCEKMVGLLKDAVRKMDDECEGGLEMMLYWAVAAKNCLHNQRGFSPNQLVFGRNPGLPDLQGEVGIAGLRMKEAEEDVMRKNLEAMHQGRRIHVIQESDEKVRRALNSKVREHKLDEVQMADEVYYKRDGEKEWRGPAKVIGLDGKIVVVKHGGSVREIARVHITRISGKRKMTKEIEENKAVENMRGDRDKESKFEVNRVQVDSVDGEEVEHDSEYELINRGEDGVEALEERADNEIEENNEEEIEEGRVEPDTGRRDSDVRGAQNQVENVAGGRDNREERALRVSEVKKGDNIIARDSATGEDKEFKIVNRAGKAGSKEWSDSWNIVEKETGNEYWIDLRNFEDIRKLQGDEEVLLVCETKEVEEAKHKEFQSWKENEVYDEVEDKGQKTISVRWVITSKEKEGKRVCKARLVARGFEERDEGMSKDAPTCASETLRLCLAVMLHKGWDVKTLDVKTAYLQGYQMKREVFIKPPKEAQSKKLWRLKKTIYGLKDAARAWYERVRGVVEELGGKRSSMEPTLFFWKNEKGELIGVMCSHVDDFCFGGNDEFEQEVINRMKEILKVGEVESGSFSYIGVDVNQSEDELIIDQERYTGNIKVPEIGKYQERGDLGAEDMKVYRGIVGKMNWITQHSRPDFSFEVSEGGSHFQQASGEDMLRIIKMVKRMKKGGGKLKFQRVGENYFWEVYTDASYGNVGDGQSQIGYVISLTDNNGKRCPIHWKSVRARRVARSVTEAEAIALTEAAEMTIYLDKLLQEITGLRGSRMLMKTDNKTLELALKSSTGPKSRRLRIDLAAIREMIAEGTIEVEWIVNAKQRADVFTKADVSKRAIREYVFGERKTKNRGEE